MTDLLAIIKNLPSWQWFLLLGSVLLVGSTGITIAGVGVSEMLPGMHYAGFGGGLILVTMAWWSNEQAKRRDIEMRKAKLDAGLDPDLDKTIIR